MSEKHEHEEPTEEFIDVPAQIPKRIVIDKRLIEALELLGVKVYE